MEKKNVFPPEIPFEQWPIHHKLFGGDALPDISQRKNVFRAILWGYNGQTGASYKSWKIEWVFVADSEDKAVNCVVALLQRKVVRNDVVPGRGPLFRGEEIHMADLECWELQRVLASLPIRSWQTMLDKLGDYMLIDGYEDESC